MLAKETGFIQCERKLTGATFAQVMVFGHLQNPQASLDQLTQVAQVCGAQISSSGLHQRCTESAATFLQAVLAEVVAQVVQVKAVPVALFKRFEQVIIEDGSTITLPAALADLREGCGGGSTGSTGRTASALKLHVRLDLKHGRLIGPFLSAGRVHELARATERETASGGQPVCGGSRLLEPLLLERTRRGRRALLSASKSQYRVLRPAGQVHHVLEVLVPIRPQFGRTLTSPRGTRDALLPASPACGCVPDGSAWSRGDRRGAHLHPAEHGPRSY